MTYMQWKKLAVRVRKCPSVSFGGIDVSAVQKAANPVNCERLKGETSSDTLCHKVANNRLFFFFFLFGQT